MKKAFILMPFRAPFDSYYSKIYRPALESVEYNVVRADELYGSHPIIEDIQKSIKESDLILCDMSTRNPNVFYELGLAHAIGKPVILVSNNIDDIPFDLRHVRTIIYKTDEAGWEGELYKSIANYGAEKNLRIYPEPLIPHAEQLTSVKPSDIIKSLDSQGSLGTFVSGSTDVFMSGVTLLTRTNMLKTIYKHMLEQGCNFKFIVLDPKSPVLSLMAMGQSTTTKQLSSEIEAALNIFQDLKDYTKKHHTSGEFDFIAFNYVPTLTLMWTQNKIKGNSVIHVELPAYRSGIWERPAFRLTHADGDLFAYFNRICSDLWSDANAQRKVIDEKS